MDIRDYNYDKEFEKQAEKQAMKEYFAEHYVFQKRWKERMSKFRNNPKYWEALKKTNEELELRKKKKKRGGTSRHTPQEVTKCNLDHTKKE